MESKYFLSFFSLPSHVSHGHTRFKKKYSNRHFLIYIFVLIKSENCLNDGAKKKKRSHPRTLVVKIRFRNSNIARANVTMENPVFYLVKLCCR